jgi:hypothetical protein
MLSMLSSCVWLQVLTRYFVPRIDCWFFPFWSRQSGDGLAAIATHLFSVLLLIPLSCHSPLHQYCESIISCFLFHIYNSDHGLDGVGVGMWDATPFLPCLAWLSSHGKGGKGQKRTQK